jgi:hypothetical protein
VVTSKWVFKHKFRPDGCFEKYKAHWVVHGFTQRAGVDFDETFALVIKPATIQIVLTIVANKAWPVNQLDVSNAFLHSRPRERIYCQQPMRFIDPHQPNDVCLLSKSL